MARKANKKRDKKAEQKSNNHTESIQNEQLSFFANYKLTILQVGTLIVAFLICYNYIFDDKISTLGDNAAYYVLGKSIATGEGYVNIVSPNPKPSNHFPPGYPLILAAAYNISPDNFVFAKCINGAFLLASLLLLFFFFQKLDLRWELSMLICLLLLTNYHLLYFSTIMMSELSFLFFSVWVLYLVQKLDFTESPKDQLKNKNFYLLIVLLCIVFHIRTIGIAVAFGVIAYCLFEKKWNYGLSISIGFVALAMPWFIRGQSLGGTSYLKQLLMINPYNADIGNVGIKDILTRIIVNFERYITVEIPNGLLPILNFNKQSIHLEEWTIGILLLAIIFYGLYRLPKYRTLIGAYLLGTFGILMLWPMQWYGVRFMLPVVPLLMMLFVYGIYTLLLQTTERWSPKRLKFVHPFVLLFLVVFSYPSIKELKRGAEGFHYFDFQQYFLMADWAKENTPKGAIICCRKPNLFYLRSNRKCVNFPQTDDKELFFNTMSNKGVDYVVAVDLGNKSHHTRLLPTIEAYPYNFSELVKFNEPQESSFYEFLPDVK